MQAKSLTLTEVPHKPFGLYFFNAFVVSLIIYAQFQNIFGVPLKESMPQLSHLVFLLDKVVLFSLVVIFIYVRFLGGFLASQNGMIKRSPSFVTSLKSERILFTSLMIFVLWCLISAGVNGNDLKPTVFGTFAYIVYFLPFFVFSSIPYPKRLILIDYRLLLTFALLLSAISIFQEILALVYPLSVDWWPNIQSGEAQWRMGLFRAPSLLGHPNGIGMFALFFFTVELARARETEPNTMKLLLLGSAIFFSVSRSAMGGALIALFLLMSRFRRIMMIVWVVPAICLMGIWFYSHLNSIAEESSPGALSYDKYREFTFEKSLQIFKDHPFVGVGPGMYGGHISLRYESPIYGRYGFTTSEHFEYLRDRVGSIEQQWLQILPELGVAGMLIFIMLLGTPIFILRKLRQKEKGVFFKGLYRGLMIMPIQMEFYMVSFTVSQQQEWLVPYFAFVGMLVGAERRRNENGNF